jgi:hypothetical protein
LNSVTSSRDVPSYVKVGTAEVFLLKKTMTFVLLVFSLSPFQTCVVTEYVCSHRICSAGAAEFQPCLKPCFIQGCLSDTKNLRGVPCVALFLWLVTQRLGFEPQQARSFALLLSPLYITLQNLRFGCNNFPSVWKTLCTWFFKERLALHTFLATAPCVALLS